MEGGQKVKESWEHQTGGGKERRIKKRKMKKEEILRKRGNGRL